jgi:diacylglycerol O-acyltransferase/trehalose O-mycolyltransferase
VIIAVAVTTDFYRPRTHTWPYWERELHRSLPMLLAALDRRAVMPR